MRSLASFLLLAIALLPFAVFADRPALQSSQDATLIYDLASREAQYQRLVGIPDARVQYDRFGRVRQLDGHTGVFVARAAQLKQGDAASLLQ